MNNLLQHSRLFLKKNASTILTCVGGIGVIATSVMAVKATPKALSLLDEAKEEKGENLTKTEVVKIAGPAYIPAIITGTATIACIFGANILNKHHQAALMSAYALLDNTYKDYQNKVKELYGEDIDSVIKDEIVKDKYKNTDISVSEEKQLFYDEYSQRYFESTTEDMLRAEMNLNRALTECGGVYLNEYFELIGLEPTDYGNHLGWSASEIYETYWSNWVEFEHRKVFIDDLEVTIVSIVNEPTFSFEDY